MTREEFKDVAKILNSIYEDNGKLMFEVTDVAKMQTWYSLLSDLEYEGVAAAVHNIAMRSPFRPKPADIRKEYAAITTPEIMNEQEAWEIVADGIRNGTYGSEEEFAKFPEIIKKAVATPYALKEWAQLPSEKVHTVIAAEFKNAYRAVCERHEQDAVLGAIGTRRGELLALAVNIADAKRIDIDTSKD